MINKFIPKYQDPIGLYKMSLVYTRCHHICLCLDLKIHKLNVIQKIYRWTFLTLSFHIPKAVLSIITKGI